MLKKQIKMKTINWKNNQKNNKAMWNKVEELKKIELNAFPVYGNRYINTKIKLYSNKFYANFRGLNVAEDDTECEYFKFVSIDSLLIYKNK